MVETESQLQGSQQKQRWRVIPPRRELLPPGGPPPRPPRDLGHRLRSRFAMLVGRMAAAVSRMAGMGSGAMIGGRIAQRIQPSLLPELVRGKQVVMVTGTNGKTTTTQLITAALGVCGRVVSNGTGANMLDGHVAALLSQPKAKYAALEVDELHLAQVTKRFSPEVMVLLNLSRDQLDRVGEIRSVERSIRSALARAPSAQVVANRDDPNIVSAAFDHPHVTWISGGMRWKHDALNCPRCGAFLSQDDGPWVCSCGLERPEADWEVTDSTVIGPDGRSVTLSLRLPGQINRLNAAFALAVGTQLGGSLEAVVERVQRVEQAAGRYEVVWLGQHRVRLLLAKNPASWLEMLQLVATHDRPLIVAVNSREADGYDVSWLWDIDFELLAGRFVMACGDRALDLAVRLRYAGVDCRVADSVEEALAAEPFRSGIHSEQTAEVIANYTAFRDLFTRSSTS